MKWLFFFCATLFFFLFPIPAHAEDKVTTSVQMDYSVTSNGNTHATAHIILTNTTPNFYVSTYGLKLGFDTISNITASDPSGPLIPVIKQTPTGEEIDVTFKTVSYGTGSTLPFTLSFDTPDIATENGSIWEVNIPGISNQNDFTNFLVTVSVPADFGSPTYAKPPLVNGLQFDKSQLGHAGISLGFGNNQNYAYNVSYHLENPNLFPLRESLALIPTTNYQTVSLDSITPRPDSVHLDGDGNWIADYTLTPSQQLTVSANGLIALSFTPKPVPLPQSEHNLYVQPQPYWQVNTSTVKNLATQLKTPEAIYNYVVSHLSYDFSRVKNDQVRVGALGVLQNPTSAVCLEFTDLFIAIARAAGIPAREIDGYGYTQNTVSRPISLGKDILHAWPEYYDGNTWVMVDPTWGNTTGGVDYFHQLDFDHVAFVVKGVSSTTPIPAGGYKLPGGENTKDVSIVATQETITTAPTFTSEINLPTTNLAGLPISGSVILKNSGNVLIPPGQMTILAHILTPLRQQVAFPAIPPFGIVIQPIAFNKTKFLTNAKDTVTISLDGNLLQQYIRVVPITQNQLILGGIVLVLLIALIWIIATRPWRISVS